jgi:hypothetical protein
VPPRGSLALLCSQGAGAQGGLRPHRFNVHNAPTVPMSGPEAA